MKFKTILAKFILILSFLLFNHSLSFSQVGINTTSPSAGAILDVDSSDKGLLVPRVDITNLNNIAPVTGGSTEGLLVYNTNTTTGTGFHYWSGTVWIPLNSNDWKVRGNAGTTPGVDANEDFIGTSDNQDLYIARNALERITLTAGETSLNNENLDIDFNVRTENDDDTFFVNAATDNVGIGVNNPAANTKLEVYNANNDAISGYSDNVGGILGRETNISFGSPVQTIQGAGVYANNPNAGYTSMFAQSTGNANVGALGSYSDVWIAGYDYVDNSRDTYNPPASYSQLNITTPVLGGYKAAVRAYANRGSTAGNPGFTVGVQAQAVADNEDGFGISAAYFGNSSYTAGGEFISASSGGTTNAYALVGAYYFGTAYKILGFGAVSTIVTDDNDQQRIMYAPEAPEVLLQDYGVGTLVNGTAEIAIDPILAKNIHVDVTHPLKVFVTLEGDCNGIYVTNKSKNGFTVKELQNGRSNIDFSWQIVATRADDTDGSGRTVSTYKDLRFPEFNMDNNGKVRTTNGQRISKIQPESFTRQ